jgi:predicted MFS family arabinose efflux permease
VTNSGGTAAFILGVPLATALGHALGWRWAFVVMGVVVLFFTLLVVLFLPPVRHLEELATGEIRIPTHRDRTLPAVLVVCVTVVLIITGQNIFYTYIAPWLIGVASFSPDAVPSLLFVYGAAGAIGLLLAGILGDRFPRASVSGLVAALALSITLLALSAAVPWLVIGSLVLWSISFGGLPALFHARVLHTASHNIRDLAAAWLTTSFNLAIGGGALIGGLLLDRLGLVVLPWAEVILVLFGLAFIVTIDFRRSRAAALLGPRPVISPRPSPIDLAVQVDGQAQYVEPDDFEDEEPQRS